MNIHSVLVSYHRFELTRLAIKSYYDTATGPGTLLVVDNGSGKDVEAAIEGLHGLYGFQYLFLGENKYPGFATNRGWEMAHPNTALLHRMDNDFVLLDGWETHVRLMFTANPRLGQLGLRTDDEELHNQHNVGGNCVIRKQLWDEGLRYDERSWPEISAKVPGYTEDSFLSPEVRKMGWEWGRVTQPCIRSISVESADDPYYEQTWTDRGMR